MQKFYWQNLVFKKCPKCHERLNEGRLGFGCPGKAEGKCEFFLSRLTMAKILTDPTHAAIRFLAPDTREQLINKALREIGIPDINKFWEDFEKEV